MGSKLGAGTPFARHPTVKTWHFHLDCSGYPAGCLVERQFSRPIGGGLCRECGRLAKRARAAV
jgi:hypothetical protein